MPDEVDARHCRREAERCRWLAAMADEETARILVAMAQEFELRAAELDREQKPVGLHPTSDPKIDNK